MHIPGSAALNPTSTARTSCLVLDLSAEGARVTFLESFRLPPQFYLFIGSSHKPHRVRTISQSANTANVQFLETRVAPEVMPG